MKEISSSPATRQGPSWISVLIAGVAMGAVFGAGMMWLGSRQNKGAVPPAASESAAPSADNESLEQRMQRLERMQASRATAQLVAQAPAADPSIPDRLPPIQSAEERRAFVLSHHQESLDRHRAQAVDATWAARATESVRTTVGTVLATEGGQLKDLDCRSTMCVASIQWESEDKARRAIEPIGTADYMGCRREVLVPPDGITESGVSGRLVVDCSK